VQKFPPPQNSGAICWLSKQHDRSNEKFPSRLFSAALEPAGCAVFLLGNYMRALDQTLIERPGVTL
jgi:hypothetical protein